MKFFIFFVHSALHHHARRCTIDAVAKIKPEVGVAHQNSVNGGFSSLDSTIYIFLKFFFFFIELCIIMLYDTLSTPSPKSNRKWACSATIASKWRFFVPGLYIFFKIFLFFHSACEGIATCPQRTPITPTPVYPCLNHDRFKQHISLNSLIFYCWKIVVRRPASFLR